MNSLQELIGSMVFNKISTNEQFYRFKDLEQHLLQLKESKIIVCDSILTPYYISNGLVYELYEYELCIRLVKEIDLEKHLLQKTGKANVNEVSPNTIRLYNKCNIEIPSSVGSLLIKDLLDYIEFVYSETDLIKQINKQFETFNTENLFFLYY